jgi:hypothetical protein
MATTLAGQVQSKVTFAMWICSPGSNGHTHLRGAADDRPFSKRTNVSSTDFEQLGYVAQSVTSASDEQIEAIPEAKHHPLPSNRTAFTGGHVSFQTVFRL